MERQSSPSDFLSDLGTTCFTGWQKAIAVGLMIQLATSQSNGSSVGNAKLGFLRLLSLPLLKAWMSSWMHFCKHVHNQWPKRTSFCKHSIHDHQGSVGKEFPWKNMQIHAVETKELQLEWTPCLVHDVSKNTYLLRLCDDAHPPGYAPGWKSKWTRFLRDSKNSSTDCDHASFRNLCSGRVWVTTTCSNLKNCRDI